MATSPEGQIENLSPAKRALYEIRSLRARVQELELLRDEPLAIVGMGLRFPGDVSSADGFWRVLAGGVDAVSEVPSSRWPVDRYYDPDPDAPGKMSTRHGAFAGDPALFDAGFFGISPREALSLDPQHRVALEVAWEALENAGRNPAGLDGSLTGVFLALSNSDYGRKVFGRIEEVDAYSSTGNIFSVAAGRISFTLGLQGPSMVLDTACSGSLVAVHLACQSLRARECSFALAGGVNLILSPEISVNFSKSRMMATDGKCKTFDAAADGYVRGEGCGMVVLKRLSDALADGDRILAVIRGSAVNQDGRSSGLTAPNGSAQEAVIRQALANAGVRPEEISYVEAHGTGTSLGDPIEAHALASVLGAGRSAANPLTVGSVKTNLGHLESAAGIAGLIKTVLSLQHQQIPKHLHFHALNPHIDWAGIPVEIPVEARPWPSGGRKRLAGVSSFGFSGTNAHVIVEEAPVAEPSKRERERPLHILTVSARSQTALRTLTERYAEELEHDEADLGDICFTANAGRAQFEHRAVYVAATRGEMRDRLGGEPLARGQKNGSVEAAFLFPGQGAQYAGMGKELYDTHPEFRHVLEECSELLKGELEEPLLEVLWGSRTGLLEQTQYTQPALFAVEYGIAQLWRSWGIEPAAVVGHSVGEYVAACVAGVYGLAEGLKLIARRGRLMQGVQGRGAMAAAMAREERVKEALEGLEQQVSIAALNAAESVVIGGYEEGVREAEERLQRRGVRVERLAVSHGFHSPQMAEMGRGFEQEVKGIKFSPPRVELISSVTGKAVGAAEMGESGYWGRQVREPVRFAAAMETLKAKGYGVFVEAGPGSTLSGLGKQTIAGEETLWAPTLRKGRGEWRQMLESLGRLWARGAEVDWAGFDKPYHRRRTTLPTYPFERQRYWIENTVRRPDEFAVGERIREAAAHQAQRGRLDLNLGDYPKRWESLDKLVSAYIAAAWRELGLYKTAGERHTAESLVQTSGIRSVYQKMMYRWLERFAIEGVLTRDGQHFEAVQPLPEPPLQRLVSAVLNTFTSDAAIARYVIDCGAKLAPLLAGKESPLAILFPGGSFTRAEEIYERSAFSSYFSSILSGALEGLLHSREDVCHIVEIGGGTGGTASALFPILPAGATYHFTDVSDAFLLHARKKFAARPFIRYGLLDIERNPAEQGYRAGSFDVVVATNVLHATRDIRETLANVRSLLAPGGMLFLCEATRAFSWLEITVGLTEGWHRSDDDLRGGRPLMAVEAWQALLAESGFEERMSFPESGAPSEILGQRVFIARNARTGVATSGERPLGRPVAPEEKRENGEDAAELAQLTVRPPAQRHEILVALLRRHVAALLRFDSPEMVGRKQRLTDMGLDSLMAVEFRDRLVTALRLEHPPSATIVFDHPTIEALAEHLERDILGFVPDAELPPTETSDFDERAQELERLDDDEVEALLVRKLQAL